MQDVQRQKHCDECHLTFGLAEKRVPYEGKVVHEEPCLRRLKAADRCRAERIHEYFRDEAIA